MRLKVAILGSTGSIGKSLLNVISKNKDKFIISLLTSNKNYKTLLKQAIEYNVKNVVVTDKNSYCASKNIFKKKKIKIYNNFENLKKIFPKKIDYVMSSIVGLDGLVPTYNIIKFTNKIAIANKESIICAWNIIKNELKKNKTDFIPVDSEHFSIWYALKNNSTQNIDKLYLTASGGPLLNVPSNKFKDLKISKIINHPNWDMGAKISVDSATMVNKVFEVIEAKKIFNLEYKQLSILTHPKSYIHAIIKFKDGMINLIAHDTTMEIPIFNTLNTSKKIEIKTKNINLNNLNNLKLSSINTKKFTNTKILKQLPNKDSLFETVLVSVNDYLVELFLNKKITFLELTKNLPKILLKREFNKYKSIEPKRIMDILSLNKKIRSKINDYIKHK